jgi:hypothetical protein
MATRKKALTEEQLKEIEILKQTNMMLENSKKQAMERGKTATVKQIERAEQENIDHIKSLDPTADVKLSTSLNTYVGAGKKKKEIKQDNLFSGDELDVFSFENDDPTPLIKESDTTIMEEAENETETEIDMTPSETTTFDPSVFGDVDPSAQFDVIQLPSNGQCYKSKLDRVPVSYLTAYDENIITSPNLYKDGLVIDYLLKNKIETDEINVDDLVSGDADAIILYLRATSYGPDFPIVVRDPESGEQIETTVDLQKLKPRDR